MPPELMISLVYPLCAVTAIVTLVLAVMAGWMLWPHGRRW